jgi:hypothetical protein
MILLPSLLLLGAALIAFRGRVTPIAMTVGGMGLTLAGMAQIDDALGTAFWVPAASGTLALLIAYTAIARSRLRGVGIAPKRDERSPHVGAVVVFETFVITLVAIHFLATGIPLFSSNVEVARFDFGSSVLFGLPGRAYLFGLPFLAILSSAFAARHPGPTATWTVRVAWIAYAGAQVMTGTKGALLEVLLLLVLVRASLGRPLKLQNVLGVRFVALAAAGVAVAFFFAFQYASLQLSDPGEAVAYLQQRATVQGAQPGYLAMSELAGPHGQPYLVGDLIYTIQKYTGQHFSADTPYSLDVIVSARLIGASPDLAGFLAPVTVGAFAGWFVDAGWAGALLAMLVLGAIYGLATYRAACSASPLMGALWGFATYLLSVYIVNGSLVYWAVNGILMALAMTALWMLSRGIAAVLGLHGGIEGSEMGRQSILRVHVEGDAHG